ncbi:hypothetical protein GE061_003285 [Apolygus lucorum]|uniref:Uncharacterized protein n=1 Tax=Apolygus lucorum TaxID=248454 RepID=A0A6A4JCI4_APOLU|nr:hypothetical protein GE061_003285 [Apolygus lucorum]
MAGSDTDIGTRAARPSNQVCGERDPIDCSGFLNAKVVAAENKISPWAFDLKVRKRLLKIFIHSALNNLLPETPRNLEELLGNN